MRHRVLVIDDNPADMELMVYLLEALDCEAVTAGDVREGMNAALAEQPSLIICDIHGPLRAAIGLIDTFKTIPLLQDIPLLAVAALSAPGDRELLLDAGFDACLDKPVDTEAFSSYIEDFLLRRPAAALVHSQERRQDGHNLDR